MKDLDNSINKKKLLQALNFIEELNWLVESKSSNSIKELLNLLQKIVNSQDIISEQSVSNISALVGCLPNLFLDLDLFKTNADIAEFADAVLKIKISRFEKKSRFEIIGIVVCEVPKLKESELTSLVIALNELTNNSDELKRVKQNKIGNNFSWNETIQYLNKCHEK